MSRVRPAFIWLARLGVAAIFLGACVVKIRDPAAFDFHLTLDSTGTVVDAGTDAGLTNDCVFRTRPLGAAPDPELGSRMSERTPQRSCMMRMTSATCA